jgi:hypothetical protein
MVSRINQEFRRPPLVTNSPGKSERLSRCALAIIRPDHAKSPAERSMAFAEIVYSNPAPLSGRVKHSPKPTGTPVKAISPATSGSESIDLLESEGEKTATWMREAIGQAKEAGMQFKPDGDKAREGAPRDRLDMDAMEKLLHDATGGIPKRYPTPDSE